MDDPKRVAQVIDNLDPEKRCIIIGAGGPPCPDFSDIVESAPGREGIEGQKFVMFTKFWNGLLPLLSPREVHPLIENVVMANPADTHSSSQRHFNANQL